MKYLSWIILFALSVSDASAKKIKQISGPCSRKLQAIGDRAQDSEQFVIYLQMLLDERVLDIEDLDIFQNALQHEKMINPIEHKDKNKELLFHHTEFQKLIENHSLDIAQIKVRLADSILKIQKTNGQKEVIKRLTAEIPIHVFEDGTSLFKFTHPKLGECYKFLKKNGRVEKSEDWEYEIWPVYGLRDSSGSELKFKSSMERDPLNNTRVSKASDARAACLALGEGFDLPTADDYKNLIKHFSVNGGYYDVEKEFEKFFPKLSSNWFWTSTLPLSGTNGPNAFNGSGASWAIRPSEEVNVRCIGKMKIDSK